MIAGVICMEEVEFVVGVEVSLNGGVFVIQIMVVDGVYEFLFLEVGGDYSVILYLN